MLLISNLNNILTIYIIKCLQNTVNLGRFYLSSYCYHRFIYINQ